MRIQGDEDTGGYEMVGWHHWLKGHESEQTPGDGEGQGNLACCSQWGRKELDRTERLNNNNNYSATKRNDIGSFVERHAWT